jgi:6-phosphofructokinase 2
VDASGEPLEAALGEGIFAFKPNQREMEALTGETLDNRERQANAARAIVDRGNAELVALTLAADGALFASAEGVVRVPAPRIEKKSAVGAGDSFLAGLVLKLAEDRPWREAFRHAAAAGGSALSTPGTELCRRDQTEALERALQPEEQT